MMFFLYVCLCLSLVLGGCATQRFDLKSGGGRVEEDKMQLFFVSGIGQKKALNPASICKGAGRVARVEVEQTGIDVLLAMLTSGIFTPRNARVYCR